MTAEWYKAFYQNEANIGAITKSQIQNYTALAKEKQILWAM
jgi:hypothetical protein